ncbi:MAG TPA: T9SS type A sorting domain-containing protein [Cytophagales bacterium]|nr:T9SS type A sorting domain-containing protein [Cytophagales bacterium]
MKNLLYKLCTIGLVLAFSTQAFAQTPQQRQKARPKGTTSLPHGYYEYLPSNYNSASKLPVVIFFHGINEKGNGTSQLHYVLRQGPAKMVTQGKDFPFILISPQHNHGWWNSISINRLIDYIVANYKVDPARIYVTGISSGGYGTWEAGQTASSKVAAIVPICGCGSDKQAAKMKDMAVWAFHNDKDMVVNSKCSIVMVNAIKAAGGHPKLTLYSNYSHDAWTRTYNDQKMWDWLLSQRKGKVPDISNKTPEVNAGSDKTITLPANSISIASTSSDSDGSISSRVWKKMSGPSATLSETTGSTLKISKMVAGTYVFRITVKDNDGASDYDEVKVVVNNSSNKAPVVNAGSDKTITLPTNSASLSSTSSDSDGSISSRLWEKVSGPTATLSGATGSTLNISQLLPGTYVFRITVKDNRGAANYDDVKITVKAKTPDTKPSPGTGSLIVNAGEDKVIILPQNTLTLTAKATGSKGHLTYCLWKRVTGPSVKMVNHTQKKMNLSALVEGTYVFSVTIKDNLRASSSDEVKITVRPADNEPLPITEPTLTVNAGSDQIITLPETTVKLSAVTSNTEGKLTYALWKKLSGPAVNMRNYSQKTMYLSKFVAGTYVFGVTVKNSLGMSAYDEVKVTVKKSSSARLADAEVSIPEYELYPNPAVEKFNLNISNKEDTEVQVFIIDSKDGKIIRNQEIWVSPDAHPEINVAGLPSGVYFVKVIADGQEKALRLVKL